MVSEARMFHTVETLVNGTDTSCPEARTGNGGQVSHDGRTGVQKSWWENGSTQGSPLCSADHWGTLPQVTACTHRKYRHGALPLRWFHWASLSPALSLDMARVTSNLNNHKFRTCTWRSHRTHDLNVH